MTGPALLITWHSRTGTAEALAMAAMEGAGTSAGRTRVEVVHAASAGPGHFLAAGACLFVCPENLGTMSGAMKEMFDRLYYPLLGRIEGRSYATIVAAGSAGQGAEAQIDRIVTGWRLRRVAPGLIASTGAQTPEAILAPKQPLPADLEQARQLGAALAEGLTLGIF